MDPPNAILEIAAVLDRFESAWRSSNDPPNLEVFLGLGRHPGHDDLFRGLLTIDVEFRQRRSISCTPDSYRQQFPQFESIIDAQFAPDTVSVDQDSSIHGGSDSGRLPDTVALPDQLTADRTDQKSRQTIGRYTVLSRLGGGGQASVFRAAHPTLPVEVAIKVGNKQLDEAGRQAMHDEAQVLCGLDHPNIAKVRDLEFDDRGYPILVLELLRGRSLAHVLSEGEISQHRFLHWLAAVADALDYAHRRGVLHLDLKPGNVVIDENDQAKVIDFGLARSRDMWTDVADEKDRISGTPEYMAPEQAQGDSKSITARTDVFALGAILYRLLTGAAPFFAASTYEALQRARQFDLDLQLLSTVKASDRMINICRRALDRDPSQRFESAAAFASELRQAADQATREAGSKPKTSDVPRWIPWLIAVGCILAIAVGLPSMFRDRDTTVAQPSHPEIQAFEIDANRTTGFHPIGQLAPLRDGDNVRFSVKLDQPAFVRLLWIDAEGNVAELYPNDPELGLREARVASFESPAQLDRGWPVEGNVGIETALLLVSNKPLGQIALDTPNPSPLEAQERYSVRRFRVTPSNAQELSSTNDDTRSLGNSSRQVADPTLQMLEQLRNRVDIAEAITVPHSD